MSVPINYATKKYSFLLSIQFLFAFEFNFSNPVDFSTGHPASAKYLMFNPKQKQKHNMKRNSMYRHVNIDYKNIFVVSS